MDSGNIFAGIREQFSLKGSLGVIQLSPVQVAGLPSKSGWAGRGLVLPSSLAVGGDLTAPLGTSSHVWTRPSWSVFSLYLVGIVLAATHLCRPSSVQRTPQNLLCSREGNCSQISDFGLGTALSVGALTGSPPLLPLPGVGFPVPVLDQVLHHCGESTQLGCAPQHWTTLC